MAGASLLALLDDIASVLDDVATMTKVAAKKTAGVLGDDLALNAQQVSGVRAERELPVVWAVAVGSLRNKVILVPAALAISAWLPWAIAPLLMLGGLFLCFEGVEKLAHKFFHAKPADAASTAEDDQAAAAFGGDLAAFERDKIKGAIRTDFVLSAEIIVIALGTVAGTALGTQFAVLAGIGLIMTVGVYGLVAAIVKLDDLGLYLMQRGEARQGVITQRIGRALLMAAPKLMKALAVIGTIAMFMVGGGILTHSVAALHHPIEQLAQAASALPVGALLAAITPTLANVVVGIVAGLLVLAVVETVGAVRRRTTARQPGA